MSFQGINPNPARDAREPAASFELSDVLAVLRAKAGLILRVTVLVVAAAVVAVSLMPSTYSASAVVMLDPRKNSVADLQAVLSALPTDPASIQNQIQVLQSRDLAAKVIAKLQLYDDPEFNGMLQKSVGSTLLGLLNPKHWLAGGAPAAPAPDQIRDSIVDNFLSHLSAESVGLSTTVNVTFTSRDAAKAARIADAVAQTYIDGLVETKLKASESTSAWLTQRIRELASQVQRQEAAALTYRAEHHLDSSDAGTALIEQQIGGINGQIIQARADLSAKAAIYDQVERLMKEGRPADVSQIVASPLIIQLRTQQADLLREEAALAIPYGPKHPKRIAVENQLRDLDQKIGEEAARIASALANDVTVARAQLGSLQSSLTSTQHTVSGQDLIAVKLKALEAEADSTRKLYESFLERLRSIQDQDGLLVPDANLISHAAVAGAPTSPPKMLIVLASFPAGILLGCLIAFLQVRLFASPPRRRREPDAPRPVSRPLQPAMAGPPILADVPGAFASGAADQVVDWPASPFSRAVAQLLGRVVPARRSGQARVVAVTALAQDGAGTNLALAMARSAARAGLRTIIVDGHFQQPALARMVGVRLEGGLMDVLQGSVTVNRALTRDPRSNVLMLATQIPPRDANAALASPRVGELFRHLRAICDLVIVATPPVSSSHEAPTFARLSDAVIMAARPEEGPGPRANGALATLSQWRSAPVGLVVVR
ncbi:MAG: hypothetical protein JSR60_17395 [Proteobacteria bacterium]|nr:hypothetical protein [Pseudomonadota bacterium]